MKLDGLVAVNDAGVVLFQEQVCPGPLKPDLPIGSVHLEGFVKILHGSLEVLQLAAYDGPVGEHIGQVRR